MLSQFLSCVFALGTLAFPLVAAPIVPIPDIDRLVETSSLIVRGELVKVDRGTEIRSVPFNRSSISVRVDRGTLRIDELLGGRQESPFVFELLVPEKENGWISPVQQTYGVFFLQVDNRGKYHVTDPYNTCISLPTALRSYLVDGATPLDRVVRILSAMLSLPNDKTNNTIAVEYLQFSHSNAAKVALRAALETTKDSELLMYIANGLMLQGDAASLKFVKSAFLTGSRLTTVSFREETLGNAIAVYMKDPAAISDLEELLDAPSVFIRRGAAGALQRMGSNRAARGLAKALEDSDPQVRYSGVIGLADLTQQYDSRPSEVAFGEDETKYLSYWKAWAKTRK